MRRVLMVAYFFPPLGGGGIQRTLKFATYLPRVGWQPVVVTPRNADYEPMDPDLVAQIPAEAEVHRSFCWEPSRLYRWLVRAVRYRPVDRDAQPAANRAGDGAVVSNPGRWARLADILFFPDLQIFWIPFAVRSGLRAHRARPVSAIFSSSPPVTTHLIAGLLKRLTGLPWVADFRDPWIGNVYAAELPRPHRWLRKRVERWIVHHADRVVFATPSLTQEYVDRYPDRASQFVTITNGYDAIDLAAIDKAPHPGPVLRIVYTGSLYGHDELPTFLDGLQRFLDRDPGMRERLSVEFVGLLNARNQAIAARYSAPERLGGVVAFAGFLPHHQALRRLESADVALMLVAGDPGKEIVVSGKLYEYLGADKPILAMVPEGDARSILRELDWGVIADPDADSVADALARLMEMPESPGRAGRADPEQRYERAQLAAHLGRILTQLAAPRPSSPRASAEETSA